MHVCLYVCMYLCMYVCISSMFSVIMMIVLAAMYGFGAVADITLYLPLLRNVLGWFTAGSATYSTIRNGLLHVRMYVLPE